MILSFCTVETLPQTLYIPSNDRPDGREIIRLHNRRLLSQAQSARHRGRNARHKREARRRENKLVSPSRLGLRARLNKRSLCRPSQTSVYFEQSLIFACFLNLCCFYERVHVQLLNQDFGTGWLCQICFPLLETVESGMQIDFSEETRFKGMWTRLCCHKPNLNNTDVTWGEALHAANKWSQYLWSMI